MNPAIVVVAFNRPKSLERLLTSIGKSSFSREEKIELVISVDRDETDSKNKEVISLAEEFRWPHGPLSLIIHELNLGLKNHILFCGDLTIKYGSVIVLEDDLAISPFFYRYSLSAIEYYRDCYDIAGISLYKYEVTEGEPLPFYALEDGSDVFFMQMASSWGQIWTYDQWKSFRSWFVDHPLIPEDLLIMDEILKWPDSSWKKHFIHYLIDTKKYFVFPRVSLSTNFGDTGTHMIKNNNYQVPLLYDRKEFIFRNIEHSVSKYDSFFELQSESFKLNNDKLRSLDFEVDVYGRKSMSKIRCKWILTSKALINYKYSFGLRLKPHELNIFHNINGRDIFFGEKCVIGEGSEIKSTYNKVKFEYYFGHIREIKVWAYLKDVLLEKILRRIIKLKDKWNVKRSNKGI